MLNTSGDILNLVLALAIAVLTIFIVIAIYYFIASIRKVHNVINKIEDGVVKAEEVVSLVKNKINSSSSHLMVVAEFAKQAIKLASDQEWFKKKKNTSEKKKGKK